jgi:hypothetical protein
MQPLYANAVNEYELKGNALAQCMERTTMFGWRCYSWVLLVLFTALVGVSVALGVVANEPKSKCFGKQIRSPGTYDPTKYCLAWFPDGLTAMADGTCPNECDQELYESHITSSERRLTATTDGGDIDSFCQSSCGNYVGDYSGTYYDDCNNACTSTNNETCVNALVPPDSYDTLSGCAIKQAYSVCFSQSDITSQCTAVCTAMVNYFNDHQQPSDFSTCKKCCVDPAKYYEYDDDIPSGIILKISSYFDGCRKTAPPPPSPHSSPTPAVSTGESANG